MPNVKVECVRRVGKYFNTIVYYIVFPLPFGSDPLQGSRKHTVEVFVGVRAVPLRFFVNLRFTTVKPALPAILHLKCKTLHPGESLLKP